MEEEGLSTGLRSRRGPVVWLAVIVEGGLAVAALVLGWIFGIPVLDGLHGSAVGWGAGVAGAGALLGVLGLCKLYPVGPVGKLMGLVDDVVGPLFKDCRVADLLVISVLAGLGEELFFRGFLQDGLVVWLTPVMGATPALWGALGLASIVFGLAHFLSVGYAVFATVLGFFLGWIYMVTGDLVTPIVAHALYDFLALLILVRGSSGMRVAGSEEGEAEGE